MSTNATTEKTTIRTSEEIQKLQQEWLDDPAWDIEFTEGFEAHHEELKTFHEAESAKWEAKVEEERRQAVARLQKKVNDLGCSYAVAALLDDLEHKVDRLSREVGRSNDPDTVVYRLERLEGKVF